MRRAKLHNERAAGSLTAAWFRCLAIAAPRSGLAWKNSIDVGAGVIGEGDCCDGGNGSRGSAAWLQWHFVGDTDHRARSLCLLVADEDYRGNVGVILFNHSDTEFKGACRRGAAAAAG